MTPERRYFFARYRRGVLPSGPVGCVAFPVLVLAGAFALKNLLIAIAAAALALVMTAFTLQQMRRNRPALLLNADGVRLDGLPTLPWSAVLSVRKDPDNRAETGLILRLRSPLGQILRGRLRAAPLWRPFADDALLIDASLLEDPPGDVERAFRHFLAGPQISPPH